MARRPSYSNGGFRADILTWISKVDTRLTQVVRTAPLELVDIVRRPVGSGGHMPVKTGNLRNSLRADKSTMPSTVLTPAEDERLPDPRAQIQGVSNSLRVGERLLIGFTVSYATYQERRHAFVSLAAQRWQQIVDKTVRAVVKGFP